MINHYDRYITHLSDTSTVQLEAYHDKFDTYITVIYHGMSLNVLY
jgi:hypothetical protein